MPGNVTPATQSNSPSLGKVVTPCAQPKYHTGAWGIINSSWTLTVLSFSLDFAMQNMLKIRVFKLDDPSINKYLFKIPAAACGKWGTFFFGQKSALGCAWNVCKTECCKGGMLCHCCFTCSFTVYLLNTSNTAIFVLTGHNTRSRKHKKTV